MAIGDDAIAAGMANVNGATTPANTIDTEIMLTRDYIAPAKLAVEGATASASGGKLAKWDANGRLQTVTPIGATDLANKNYVDTKVGTLGTAATKDVAAGDSAEANKVPIYNGARQLTTADPTAGGHAASMQYVDNTTVSLSGDTMSGQLYLPASIGATSGFTVAYINGDGRVSRGTSSERFKKHISPIGASVLGDIFPELFKFQMRQGDGSWKFGYIAERLAESEALRPFVVWETVTELDDAGKVTGSHLALDEAGHPIPLSIDFIGLLLAQVAQLHVRVAALEAQR